MWGRDAIWPEKTHHPLFNRDPHFMVYYNHHLSYNWVVFQKYRHFSPIQNQGRSYHPPWLSPPVTPPWLASRIPRIHGTLEKLEIHPKALSKNDGKKWFRRGKNDHKEYEFMAKMMRKMVQTMKSVVESLWEKLWNMMQDSGCYEKTLWAMKSMNHGEGL